MNGRTFRKFSRQWPFLFIMAKKVFYNENEIVFQELSKHKNFKNITGLKFNKLTVLGLAGKDKSNNLIWFCKCECNKVKKVLRGSLVTGTTKSCGCISDIGKVLHGHTTRLCRVSPTYSSWQSMLKRCTNPKNPSFKNYGGRGIKVCERWRKFVNFLADMGERPKGKTLDRKENDKGYYKENCRWATQKEQCNNKRGNVLVHYDGKTQTLAQWEMEKEMRPSTINNRLKLGWSIKKAIETPCRKP